MAALQRAITLENVHEPAVAVAEDLDLDVARPLDQPLDVERAVGERSLRLTARGADRFVQFAGGSHRAHAFAAAAAAALSSAGKPTSATADAMSASACDVGVTPGTTGTPAADISARARQSSIPCAA